MIRFWQDKRGSVAIIVAVSAMMLVVIAGAAVDLVTSYYVRVSLQSALDSAALAAGRSDVDPDDSQAVTEKKLAAEAQNVFNANFDLSSKLVTVQPLQVSYTPPVGITPDTVLVSSAASVPTNFLRIVGIPQFNLTVSSKSQRPQPGPVDLVLVLDTTASMSSPPSGGGEAKLTSLKTAAKELVNQVMASGHPNIRVGVVPYTSYVFIGSPADPNNPPFWILPIQRNEKGVCTQRGTTGCTSTTFKCVVDGVETGDDCISKVCPCIASVDRVYPWNGTVGARSVLAPNNPDNRSLNKNTDAYLGRIDDLPKSEEEKKTKPAFSGQNDVAASGGLIPTQIRPLTSNKSDVLATIESLKAAGDTHIPTGLIWGWNVLTPEVPYTEGRTMEDLELIGGRKVLLLMTDGINANSPRLWDGAILKNSSASPGWQDGTKSNQLTADLCNSIKGGEIQIYTVRFDVPTLAQGAAGIADILKNCATDPDKMSFEATNRDGLLKAFRNITDQLKTLKILQ